MKKTLEEQTQAEKFLRGKYKLCDFHDLTLNGVSWLEIMEEYIQYRLDKLSKTAKDLPNDLDLATEVAVKFITRNPHPKSKIYLEYEKKAFIDGSNWMKHFASIIIAKKQKEIKEVLIGHRKLAREIDIIINGEEGAATQASLCDLVGEISELAKSHQQAKEYKQIVELLAQWSEKYPRGIVYHPSKMTMDDELIEIENKAKELCKKYKQETK